MNTAVHTWSELADAVLTHDLPLQIQTWREVTCTTCGDTALPGEHLCAEHFIAASHRRADQDRADSLNVHRGAA
jgi:hypothetical protein